MVMFSSTVAACSVTVPPFFAASMALASVAYCRPLYSAARYAPQAHFLP